jgi:hypothetical protein
MHGFGGENCFSEFSISAIVSQVQPLARQGDGYENLVATSRRCVRI